MRDWQPELFRFYLVVVDQFSANQQAAVNWLTHVCVEGMVFKVTQLLFLCYSSDRPVANHVSLFLFGALFLKHRVMSNVISCKMLCGHGVLLSLRLLASSLMVYSLLWNIKWNKKAQSLQVNWISMCIFRSFFPHSCFPSKGLCLPHPPLRIRHMLPVYS